MCVHVRSTCTPPPSNVQTAEGEGTVQCGIEMNLEVKGGRNIIYRVAALAIMPVVDPWRWNDLIHGHGQSLSPAGSHRHCLTFQEREKSSLHPLTIAKVWFLTFNYETGQYRPSNCQNRANLAPGVVFKVVFHFVRIKNIQFYTKKFISNSF